MYCPICNEKPALNSGWQWNGQRWSHYHAGAHVPAVKEEDPAVSVNRATAWTWMAELGTDALIEKVQDLIGPIKENLTMPDKVINRPTFKLGRKRPIARCPRLSIKNYLLKALPAPPAGVGYQAAAKTGLSLIYGNDTVGDCVEACMLHIQNVFEANSLFAPAPIAESVGISLYSDITGYIPGVPSTDQGTNEQDALNYWQQKGLGIPYTNPIAGWMAVDATSINEVRMAIWLFENIMFGVELPDEWITPFPSRSGFTWDVAGSANPNNGHCFPGLGYDQHRIGIDSWGLQGYITNAAIAQYASSPDGSGELYTVLSPDAINRAKQKAPNGFDWTQLEADFQAMGGSLSS